MSWDWFMVAYILRDIHHKRLYRKTHRTFTAYALDVWGVKKAKAYRMVRYADLWDETRPYMVGVEF